MGKPQKKEQYAFLMIIIRDHKKIVLLDYVVLSHLS